MPILKAVKISLIFEVPNLGALNYTKIEDY